METIRLSPSELLVLLMIHQQRIPEMLRVAGDDFNTEIRYLMAQGLVKYDGTHYLTPFGIQRVEYALGG